MQKTVTFFTAGEDVFLRDIVLNLRKDYNVKMFKARGNDEQAFFQAYHNTDVAWFEWCDGLFKEAMIHPKICKVINRLHSYELFTPLPGQIDWNKVDKLVVVSDTAKNLVIDKFKIRPDIFKVIHNGVNINKYTIPDNKKYNKKIVYVGFLNYKKAPELLLQFWYQIWKQDPTFEFHIAGDFQDERYVLYFNAVANKMPFQIHFDGWIKNMPEYFKDKDYVMSTSLFESFQYSLAEGMSQGVVPLIHGWLGSDKLYPKDFIFYNSDECIDIIKSFETSDQNVVREEVRKHIVDNYSLEKSITSIKEMIDSL